MVVARWSVLSPSIHSQEDVSGLAREKGENLFAEFLGSESILPIC